MEIVGQYFKDEELHRTQEFRNAAWAKVAEQAKASPHIFKLEQERSLLQVLQALSDGH